VVAALLGVVAAGLAATVDAGAHVTAVPTFVPSGEPERITLVAPNEREVPMSAFTVTVPSGLSIVRAVPPGDGWRAAAVDATATWSGGSLPAGSTSSFSLVLEATGDPGAVTLEAHQHYPDGGHVRWDVPLTILPGSASAGSSGSSGPVLLVAGIGLVLAAGLVVALWLRRARPLQER
jgi:uncharacterized protein YcnI